jgi:hypothetical protein
MKQQLKKFIGVLGLRLQIPSVLSFPSFFFGVKSRGRGEVVGFLLRHGLRRASSLLSLSLDSALLLPSSSFEFAIYRPISRKLFICFDETRGAVENERRLGFIIK